MSLVQHAYMRTYGEPNDNNQSEITKSSSEFFSDVISTFPKGYAGGYYITCTNEGVFFLNFLTQHFGHRMVIVYSMYMNQRLREKNADKPNHDFYIFWSSSIRADNSTVCQ